MRGILTTITLCVCLFGVATAGILLTTPAKSPVSIDGAWGDFAVQGTATLLGALVATAVSYHLAHQTRLNESREAAFRLLVKVSLVTNDFHNIMAHVDDSLRAANVAGRTNWQMWQRIKPLVGLGDPISFEAAELAPFMSSGAADLVNDVIELGLRHQAFLASFEVYNRLRMDLAADLPINSVEEETVGASVPKEDRPRFEARANEIEMLVRQIVSSGREHLRAAYHVGDRIGPVGRRMFGRRNFPTLGGTPNE